MLIDDGLVARCESLRALTTGAQVLDFLEDCFRSLGSTHFLATGLPLPARSIEPLILRMNWGDLRFDRASGDTVKADDPVLRLGLSARRALAWPRADHDAGARKSLLLSRLGAPDHAQLVAIPIRAFQPYQGLVLGGGTALCVSINSIFAIEHICIEGFRRLFDLDFLRRERPGDLSARERMVVVLSASGKTANEIADVLNISQRTVHAHLHNASQKLLARNKTHTVVEAIRYGQISV